MEPKKILSDEEMAALEASSPQPKKLLSDSEMAALESQSSPSTLGGMELVSEKTLPKSMSDLLNPLPKGMPLAAPIPLAPASSGGILSNGSSALKQILQAGEAGAVQAGAEKMANPDMEARAKAVGMGGIEGLIGGTAGVGMQKLAGKMMEAAANIKDKGLGIGERLADMGIWGTRKGIAERAASEMPKQEAIIKQAVGQLQGKVEPEGIASAIRQKASAFTPSGEVPVPSENIPYTDYIARRAQEALNRGDIAPKDALSLSRAIAKPAYNRQEPLNAFKHQISQTEAASIKDALKKLGEEQGISGVTEGLANERALYKAIAGVEKPETTGELLSRYGTGILKAAALGGATGNPLSVLGVATSSPLGQTLQAQALSKAAKPLVKGVTTPIVEKLRGDNE